MGMYLVEFFAVGLVLSFFPPVPWLKAIMAFMVPAYVIWWFWRGWKWARVHSPLAQAFAEIQRLHAEEQRREELKKLIRR